MRKADFVTAVAMATALVTGMFFWLGMQVGADNTCALVRHALEVTRNADGLEALRALDVCQK